MNEKYVTNLEISKKLKKLGVKQKSIWFWVKDDLWKNAKDWDLVINSRGSALHGINYTKVPDYGSQGDNSYGWRHVEEMYSAFLVGELGEMLPPLIKLNGLDNDYFAIKKTYCLLIASYGSLKKCNRTLSEALGRMLIYLLENKLIKVEGL